MLVVRRRRQIACASKIFVALKRSILRRHSFQRECAYCALMVHPSLRVHDLKQFIAYAQANPGKLSYSSVGVRSASHLAAELLKNEAGIEMVRVPNKGMNPALIDLMGGNTANIIRLESRGRNSPVRRS